MRLHVVVPIVFILGCGAGPTATRSPALDQNDPKRLFPMAPGNVWSYDVDTGDALPTLAISRVQFQQGPRFEVITGSKSSFYEYRQDGIYKPLAKGWLLRSPIRRGERWPAGNGRTADIVADNTSVDTPAGRFSHCVRVLETEQDAGRRIETVYCPDVGPVLIRSSLVLTAETASVTATLRGYKLQGTNIDE